MLSNCSHSADSPFNIRGACLVYKRKPARPQQFVKVRRVISAPTSFLCSRVMKRSSWQQDRLKLDLGNQKDISLRQIGKAESLAQLTIDTVIMSTTARVVWNECMKNPFGVQIFPGLSRLCPGTWQENDLSCINKMDLVKLRIMSSCNPPPPKTNI